VISVSTSARVAVVDLSDGSIEGSQHNQTIGWFFQLNSPVTVNELGVYDDGLDGFVGSHEVGIWTLSGNLLSHGTLAAGTSGDLFGNYRYIDVPDVVLPVGDYVIGTHFGDDTAGTRGDFFPQGANAVFDPAITYLGRAGAGGPGFTFPTPIPGDGDNNFMSPNFQFEAIAGQYDWAGTGGDTDFANPANWSPTGVPGSGDSATINGPATIHGEGQPLSLTVNGRLDAAGLTLDGSTIVNDGEMVAEGAGQFLRFVNSSVENNSSVIRASTGGLVQFDVGTTLSGGSLISDQADAVAEINGATLSVDSVEATNGGAIVLNGGTLSAATVVNDGVAPHAFDQNGGRLEVRNFQGTFEQDGGVFAPGPSTSVSTLSGIYILDPDGTLEIELGGSSVGDFDQLLVAGDVQLNGGALSVVALGGFSLSAGDSFGIMRVAGTSTGVFNGLNEGAFVGNFGEDLYITYEAGDGNDIGLYNPLILGSVNFSDADPDDHAHFVGDRPGSGDPAPPVTIMLAGLDLLNGSSFTLDPNETLDLGGGTLFIGEGAVFSGNGIILGNVINAGLLRIPIVRIPTIAQTSGGHIRVELPEPGIGVSIVIDIGGGSGGGFGVAGGTLLSFEFSSDEPAPIVIQGDPAPNEGTIRFDASLEITGSYEQRDTGALRLFIAGNDLPGENYSQLIVGQDVTLAGAIELVFDLELFSTFGYVPMVGDTFDIIIAEGGISFADGGLDLRNFVTVAGSELVAGVTLTDYDSGIAADPDHLLQIQETIFRLDLVENDTILRATLIAPIAFVPEPTSLLLLSLGVLALINFNRRHAPNLCI
jgi:hypothetical protein